MGKTYKRIENIDEKIHNVKLPYNAWKVFFLVDEGTTSKSVAELLGEDTAVVEEALARLEKEELIIGAESEQPGPVEQEAEKESVPEEVEEAPAAEVEEAAPEIEEAPTEMEEETLVEEEPPAVEEMLTEEKPPEQEAEEKVAASEEKAPEGSVTEMPAELISEMDKEVAEKESGQEEAGFEEEVSLDIAEEEEKEEDTEKLDIDFEAETPVGEPTEEKAAEEKPPAEAAEGKEAGEAKKSILVIDDSIVIRKMVEIALEDEKEIRVETAVKGKDGLEIMDKIQPDLVIIDLMLPDIGGIELLKTIKASRGIPVIMLSGKDSPQMIENARSEGADAFLPKPFKDEELVEKIKSLLKI